MHRNHLRPRIVGMPSLPLKYSPLRLSFEGSPQITDLSQVVRRSTSWGKALAKIRTCSSGSVTAPCPSALNCSTHIPLSAYSHLLIPPDVSLSRSIGKMDLRYETRRTYILHMRISITTCQFLRFMVYSSVWF